MKSSLHIDVAGGRVELGDQPIKTTEWQLDVTRDYIDVTSFSDTNKFYLASQQEISGTFSGPLDLAESEDVLSGAREITLFTPKEITGIHRRLLRLLGRDEPTHLYATGPITKLTLDEDAGTVNYETAGMTLYPDPGTQPAIIRRRIRAKRRELAYRFWDRFLRPTVVISEDEWQNDEYEAHEEELWYAAMERNERE